MERLTIKPIRATAHSRTKTVVSAVIKEWKQAMKITVESTVATHIEDVWSAYTTPDDIKQWNAAVITPFITEVKGSAIHNAVKSNY
jgi:hypothetical protein